MHYPLLPCPSQQHLSWRAVPLPLHLQILLLLLPCKKLHQAHHQQQLQHHEQLLRAVQL
jgi:hypothetical protein